MLFFYNKIIIFDKFSKLLDVFNYHTKAFALCERLSETDNALKTDVRVTCIKVTASSTNRFGL